MKSRRSFLKFSATSALAATAGALASDARAAASATSQAASAATTAATGLGALPGAEARAVWCRHATKLADPVLGALAQRRLKATMPVESHPKSKDRPTVTHLEALGRLLAGIAPWLELAGDASAEGRERARLAALARAAIDAATDPKSPDFLNFKDNRQPLVDAAFLAQALLRAPTELWKKLEPRVQANLVAAFKSSRPIPAGENNWKLFATTVEVALQRCGEQRDDARLFEGIRKHRDWYVGDGMYGDGAEFHFDYYNSFVIQPMLLEALDVVGGETPEWTSFTKKVRDRLTRYAAIQERLIAPDGTYPATGRSIAYRCGAFQVLALAALRQMLPKEVSPAQARTALTSVIRRTLEAPGTFDDKGWLRIGLSGHQPGLGETYISTGSLYLSSFAFLPLGLPASDPFWSAPAGRTTWERTWAGEDMKADSALKGK